MSHGHEQHGAGHGHGPKVLPASLAAPNEVIKAWRTRLLIVGGAAALISLVFLMVKGGQGHLLRAYLLGYMIAFGFAGGGLCMLMLQYVSGGKWGLLLRRPLEPMSRTLPLVFVLVLPVLLFLKHLYQKPPFENAKEPDEAY